MFKPPQCSCLKNYSHPTELCQCEMSGRPPGQIFKNAWAAFGYMGSAARNCQQGTETTLETLLEGSQGAAGHANGTEGSSVGGEWQQWGSASDTFRCPQPLGSILCGQLSVRPESDWKTLHSTLPGVLFFPDVEWQHSAPLRDVPAHKRTSADGSPSGQHQG